MDERSSRCGNLLTAGTLNPCRSRGPEGRAYWPPLWMRFGGLVLVVLICIGVHGPTLTLLGLYLLPIGLMAWVNDSSLASLLIPVSYFVYAGLVAGVFALKGKWLLIVFFALCLVVFISLVGCEKMVLSFNGIH